MQGLCFFLLLVPADDVAIRATSDDLRYGAVLIDDTSPIEEVVTHLLVSKHTLTGRPQLIRHGTEITFAVNCHLKGDGVYDLGCRAFVTCTSGASIVTECKSNYVYNSATKHCADPSTFTSLCSTLIDCSAKKDGKYADASTKCKSYYTCMGGTFFGHNYCIGGTVFNEALQICDWPVDTAPPCGIAKSG